MKKICNLRKRILLMIFFVIKFFLTIASYQFFFQNLVNGREDENGRR